MQKIWAFLLMTVAASVSAAEQYTIDSRHTFPGFEISHLGFSIQRGRFDRTSGVLMLDPEAGKGSVNIVVEAASINTGLKELEQHLRAEDFFDVKRYPELIFKSDQLRFKNKKLVSLLGTLTMHGITKPVELKVDHYHCGINPIAMKNVCGANAVGILKRSDFGIDKYVPILADEVKLVIQVEAIKN